MPDERTLWQKLIDRVESNIWKLRGYTSAFHTGPWEDRDFVIHIAMKQVDINDESFDQIMELLVETAGRAEAIIAYNNGDTEIEK